MERHCNLIIREDRGIDALIIAELYRSFVPSPHINRVPWETLEAWKTAQRLVQERAFRNITHTLQHIRT